MEIELSDLEIIRIRTCLWNEACRHQDLSEENAKNGWLGIASIEKAEAVAIMKTREKFILKK